jgi:3-oxoacyl-[acyl-carrier-protein] synthase III
MIGATVEEKAMSERSAFRILGTGIGVPEDVLTNAGIREEHVNINCRWVAERLGIKERRIARPGTLSSDLAATAISSALQQTGVAPESVDLLILATATPDRVAPSTACLAQAKAGLRNAVAFDLNSVCSGFLFALTTASAYLQAGLARRAVVVGADVFSRITDWKRSDCVFFGDGAGAVVIERSSAQGFFFDAELYSDATKTDTFTVLPNEAFTMDARGVHDAALYAVSRCMRVLIERHKIDVDQIDAVIPHQPSITLLRRIAAENGIPFEKFRTNMDRYANTASATLPIVLHEAFSDGGMKTGDLVMFAAAGSGFTAGAALYRWH